ncbi:MAG: nicotinate-nucleotide adenylyltransferase [Coriobacteriales bacterium]|jgi:nicotinate-nucleotide adenylyltransferase|nr:nicotinate-nucleotide adenylyltransferase [Coriobacteriales bacterium]
MTRRLGIIGGTFDPVHLGHLHIAEQAYAQYGLDRVLFMPTGIPAWKQGRATTPAEDRFAMLAAAIAENPHFEPSRMEIDRPGITYTIDTLRALKTLYGDEVELFFILGADTARDLDGWKDAAEIARMATILVADRPQTEPAWGALATTFVMQAIDTIPLSISASELRALAQAGRSLRYLVPEPVYAYILERGLYRAEKAPESSRVGAAVESSRRTSLGGADV